MDIRQPFRDMEQRQQTAALQLMADSSEKMVKLSENIVEMTKKIVKLTEWIRLLTWALFVIAVLNLIFFVAR